MNGWVDGWMMGWVWGASAEAAAVAWSWPGVSGSAEANESGQTAQTCTGLPAALAPWATITWALPATHHPLFKPTPTHPLTSASQPTCCCHGVMSLILAHDSHSTQREREREREMGKKSRNSIHQAKWCHWQAHINSHTIMFIDEKWGCVCLGVTTN